MATDVVGDLSVVVGRNRGNTVDRRLETVFTRTMTKNTKTRFVVEGKGRFPIDMLRYDACWPESQEDVTAIENWRDRPLAEAAQITLESWSIATPTTARWESFGWRVLPGIERQ